MCTLTMCTLRNIIVIRFVLRCNRLQNASCDSAVLTMCDSPELHKGLLLTDLFKVQFLYCVSVVPGVFHMPSSLLQPTGCSTTRV